MEYMAVPIAQVPPSINDSGTPWKLYYKGAGGWTFAHPAIGIMECRSIGMNKDAAHAVLSALNLNPLKTIEYAITLLEVDGYAGKSLQYLKAARDAALAKCNDSALVQAK